MLDTLGALSFVSIDPHPHVLRRHFSTRAVAGIDGQSIWDDGRRGQAFTVRVRAYAATYEAARQIYRNTDALADGNPVTIQMNGTAEPGRSYQVLHATPVPGRLKAIPFARGPSATYYAYCELDVTLLPI